MDCSQRRLRMLFNFPPSRLEILSPYPTYTKSELDMRRKAEILRYSTPATGTQQNSLTKNQKFALMVRGSVQTQISTHIASKSLTCPSLPTPSSSCDVPGPVISLYLDASVPLYNHSAQVRTYSILPTENVPWRYTPSNDTFIMDSARIGVLNIISPGQDYSTFSLTIPASLVEAPTLTIKYGESNVIVNAQISITPTALFMYNIQLATSPGFQYEFFLTTKSPININLASSQLTGLALKLDGI